MSPLASSVFGSAMRAAHGAAYFERVNLGERLGALPWGTRGTRAFEELSDARTKLSRLTTRAYEEAGPAIRALEAAPLQVAYPNTAQERRLWKDQAVALLRAQAGEDAFATRALAVAVRVIELVIAVELARAAAFALPAGAGDTFLRDELELQGMLAAEAQAALLVELEALDAAWDRERVSPSVLEATGELRERLATLPAITRDGARGDLARWLGSFFEGGWRLMVALGNPREPSALPPPSTRELELARRVPREPDDLALREAFAELAIGRGDPRGALVREQLRLRERQLRLLIRGMDDSELARDLVRRHPQWSEEVRLLGASEVRFWGGFIEEISIPANGFLEAAPKLFEVAPLRFARLRCSPEDAPRLLASPWLERLVALDLSKNAWSSRELGLLARSPRLSRLCALDLSHNPIDADGLDALATSTTLTSLAHVGLDATLAGPLFALEYTLQEIPTQEWLPTALGARLEARHGPRAWLRPWEGMPSLYELPAASSARSTL